MVGPDTADISETLPEAVGLTGDRFKKLKQKLSAYLSPVKNAVTERAAFHHMSMRPEEEFEQFLGRLRVQALRCGYTAAETDRELRDRCIVGSSPGLREKLLQEAANKGDGVTLDNIRQTARAYRDMRQLSAQLAGAQQPVTGADNEETAVNAVRSAQPRRGQRGQCFRCGSMQHWKQDCRMRTQGREAGAQRETDARPAPRSSVRREDHRQEQPVDRQREQVTDCQREQQERSARPWHRRVRRSAPVRRCFRCGSETHLQRSCPERAVDHVTEDSVQQFEGQLLGINVPNDSGDLPLVSGRVNGRDIEMLIDTGSPVTTVGRDTVIPGLQLEHSELRLTSFTGHVVPLVGEGTVTVEFRGRRHPLRLVVVDLPGERRVLGRDWMRALDISVGGRGDSSGGGGGYRGGRSGGYGGHGDSRPDSGGGGNVRGRDGRSVRGRDGGDYRGGRDGDYRGGRDGDYRGGWHGDYRGGRDGGGYRGGRDGDYRGGRDGDYRGGRDGGNVRGRDGGYRGGRDGGGYRGGRDGGSSSGRDGGYDRGRYNGGGERDCDSVGHRNGSSGGAGQAIGAPNRGQFRGRGRSGHGGGGRPPGRGDHWKCPDVKCSGVRSGYRAGRCGGRGHNVWTATGSPTTTGAVRMIGGLDVAGGSGVTAGSGGAARPDMDAWPSAAGGPDDAGSQSSADGSDAAGGLSAAGGLMAAGGLTPAGGLMAAGGLTPAGGTPMADGPIVTGRPSAAGKTRGLGGHGAADEPGVVSRPGTAGEPDEADRLDVAVEPGVAGRPGTAGGPGAADKPDVTGEPDTLIGQGDVCGIRVEVVV